MIQEFDDFWDAFWEPFWSQIWHPNRPEAHLGGLGDHLELLLKGSQKMRLSDEARGGLNFTIPDPGALPATSQDAPDRFWKDQDVPERTVYS